MYITKTCHDFIGSQNLKRRFWFWGGKIHSYQNFTLKETKVGSSTSLWHHEYDARGVRQATATFNTSHINRCVAGEKTSSKSSTHIYIHTYIHMHVYISHTHTHIYIYYIYVHSMICAFLQYVYCITGEKTSSKSRAQPRTTRTTHEE